MLLYGWALSNPVLTFHKRLENFLREFFERFIQGIGVLETKPEIRIPGFSHAAKIASFPLFPGRTQRFPGLLTLPVKSLRVGKGRPGEKMDGFCQPLPVNVEQFLQQAAAFIDRNILVVYILAGKD